MLRPDQMWYKIGGIVMALAEQLNITPEPPCFTLSEIDI